MMRLRRTSVTAALSLLAWAATAGAEYAWVLRDGVDTAPKGTPTKPILRNWVWVTKGAYRLAALLSCHASQPRRGRSQGGGSRV